MGFWSGEDLSANDIERARLRALARPDYIDLAGSNPTHEDLLFPSDVLRRAADGYWDTRRYQPDPRGSPAARAAIRSYYARRTPPIDLPVEQIFITASTSEAYSLVFALLCDPGDNVLAPEVTYPLFEFLAAIHHVELRPYPMLEAEGWAIDEDGLIAQADSRTRAVLVVSPHNPTGMIVDRPLPALTALGLPVVCDEVFAAFTYAAPRTPPLATLHPELPIFHLNGISKMFALPDLKLGWIGLNEPAYSEWGERLELLNDTFLSANYLTQHMLPQLFDDGEPFIEEMRRHIRRNLDYGLARLNRSPSVRVHPPDGGYYLFPEVLDHDDEETLVLRLLDAGIYVHPGYFYGYERGVHLMLSALTRPSAFEEGLDRLVQLLDGTQSVERYNDLAES